MSHFDTACTMGGSSNIICHMASKLTANGKLSVTFAACSTCCDKLHFTMLSNMQVHPNMRCVSNTVAGAGDASDRHSPHTYMQNVQRSFVKRQRPPAHTLSGHHELGAARRFDYCCRQVTELLLHMQWGYQSAVATCRLGDCKAGMMCRCAQRPSTLNSESQCSASICDAPTA